ncbi:hypothetical protein RV05_GL001341 [Enterococcus hirae]|uniref:Uncharacterized protein n=1 Tax=Enterococcus hirae (strain ATCC 9790 / DSM 20160 / JCM 8729 / LMG 6399 / NBRC 3181 / NCIMB 6459 / NCDO 1258 / NCTC 12367 / WDCM 00089 / R) TaxID=768486 RepID=G0YP61_ENTHA|nr:hypothetical protein EHR_3018 [Enterococcus hirae ATCC 9790]OJG49211.1 hypothetical protein RV05_GL001341 [Enterococcus hirae]
MAFLLFGTNDNGGFSLNDNLQLMMDQIDRVISMYQWTVGIFISIILGSLGLFGLIQFKLKKSQEENIKKEIFTRFNEVTAESLEPLILASIDQIYWSSTTEYQRNADLFFRYLELSKKYNFSEDVKKYIYWFKFSVPRAFFVTFERIFDLPLSDGYGASNEANELSNLFKENGEFTKLPDPEEVSILVKEISRLREEANLDNYGDFERVLKDYRVFYDDVNNLNLDIL